MRKIALGFALVLLPLVPNVSFAEKPATSGASSPAREEFERGSMLYDLGKYADAAAAYEHAYQLKSDPALLFNIAQAYRLGGDYVQALRSYRSFLRRVPDAQAKPVVERYIGNLEKLVQEQQRVSAVPPLGTVGPNQTSAPVDNAPTSTPPAATPLKTAPPVVEVAVTQAPPSVAEAKRPIYKKWWLWTAVVGGVLVVGAGAGLAVAFTTPKNAGRPDGAMPVSF